MTGASGDFQVCAAQVAGGQCWNPASVIVTKPDAHGPAGPRCRLHGPPPTVRRPAPRPPTPDELARHEWNGRMAQAAEALADAAAACPSALPPEIASLVGQIRALLRSRPPRASERRPAAGARARRS